MPLKHGTNSVNGVKVGEDASCGGFIGTQEVYAPPSSPLDAPTDVGVSSEVFGSLVIYWTPPAFPSGVRFRKYDVVLESRPTSTATWAVALTIPNVSVSRLTVAAITPGHQYRAKVQAFGTCGYESPFSGYSNTWTTPEGSLCVGGGCEDIPQTFSWPNGGFNDLEGMSLPVYGFTGAIPGWYCNNVDIIPKTMFEPSADPGEVCIHLKLCPKNVPDFFVPYEGHMLPPQSITPEQAAALPDTYADSWIESTLDFDPDVEHEFRVTTARHPNGDPGRIARLDLVAWAAGEAAVLGKEKFPPCSDGCCAIIPSDDPCYGRLWFFDAFAGNFYAVRLPGSSGQLAWYPVSGKIQTVADSGADRVRLRFSAFGGDHEQCLEYKRLWTSLPECPEGQQPFQWPAYEPGCKGNGVARCGYRGVDCLCPHDQNNCFGLLVDCFLPCRASYGCIGNWHALPPSYLQPGDDSGAYDEYGPVRGVRFAWTDEEKTTAECDTLEVWVANQGYECGGCTWPARFDPVPPCLNGEWMYRYYFTEHGQEVGQFLCNGVIPPSNLLVLIDEWDMREPTDPNYWWSYTSETLFANRKKWGFVGPVRLDASGEEDWGEVNPATPSCPPNVRYFLPPGARSKVHVTYVPAYNEDKVCPCPCEEQCSVRVTPDEPGITPPPLDAGHCEVAYTCYANDYLSIEPCFEGPPLGFEYPNPTPRRWATNFVGEGARMAEVVPGEDWFIGAVIEWNDGFPCEGCNYYWLWQERVIQKDDPEHPYNSGRICKQSRFRLYRVNCATREFENITAAAIADFCRLVDPTGEGEGDPSECITPTSIGDWIEEPVTESAYPVNVIEGADCSAIGLDFPAWPPLPTFTCAESPP